jgi:hypothetical protein
VAKKIKKITKPFICLKVEKINGEIVDSISTWKTKRFFHFIKAEKFTDCVFKLRISYGDGFKNEGNYRSQKDLIHALRAFTEV